MLVLTRKVGETIIAGDLVIKVTRLNGGRSVSIGIEAPGHINIRRGELDHLPPEEVREHEPI